MKTKVNKILFGIVTENGKSDKINEQDSIYYNSTDNTINIMGEKKKKDGEPLNGKLLKVYVDREKQLIKWFQD